MVRSLTEGSFINILDVDAGELQERYPNGLDDIRKERVQGFVVRNVFPAEFCARVVDRLERRNLPFMEFDFQARYGAHLMGRMIDMSQPDLVHYFNEAKNFRENCRALFEGGPDFEARLEQVFGFMSGGRRVQVPPARLPELGTYHPATVRIMPPGGHLGVHCGNEAMTRVNYKHLVTLIEDVDQVSYFVTLQPPTGGGYLRVFSLRFDQLTRDMWNHDGDHTHVDGIIENYPSVSIKPGAGDLIAFDGGRYFHLVSLVEGEKTRWTIGGFLGFGRDEQSIYYWS